VDLLLQCHPWQKVKPVKVFCSVAACVVILTGCGTSKTCQERSECTRLAPSVFEITECKPIDTVVTFCNITYSDLTACVLEKRVCAKDGKTDVEATQFECQKQLDAYNACIAKN
jgi:hypothetical protein